MQYRSHFKNYTKRIRSLLLLYTASVNEVVDMTVLMRNWGNNASYDSTRLDD